MPHFRGEGGVRRACIGDYRQVWNFLQNCARKSVNFLRVVGMSTPQTAAEAEAYVREHNEALIELVKFSNDKFLRALALAAIVEFGDEPTVESLRREVDKIDNFRGDS